MLPALKSMSGDRFGASVEKIDTLHGSPSNENSHANSPSTSPPKSARQFSRSSITRPRYLNYSSASSLLTTNKQERIPSETERQIFAKPAWKWSVFNPPKFSDVPESGRQEGGTIREQIKVLLEKKGLQDKIKLFQAVTPSGEAVTGIHMAARDGMPTIVHSAGSGACVERLVKDHFEKRTKNGAGFATYIPLGCESEDGTRSAQRLCESFEAVLTHLEKEEKIPVNQQIFSSHSWGTEPAYRSASKYQRPVILEAPTPGVAYEKLANANEAKKSEEECSAVVEQYAGFMDVSDVPPPPQVLVLHSSEDKWIKLECGEKFKELCGENAVMPPITGNAHHVPFEKREAIENQFVKDPAGFLAK